MNVSQGVGSTGRFNTTNSIKHLQKHHGKEYEDFLQSTSAKKNSEPRQQSLQETILKLEKLPTESNKAKVIWVFYIHLTKETFKFSVYTDLKFK